MLSGFNSSWLAKCPDRAIRGTGGIPYIDESSAILGVPFPDPSVVSAKGVAVHWFAVINAIRITGALIAHAKMWRRMLIGKDLYLVPVAEADKKLDFIGGSSRKKGMEFLG